MSTVIQDLNEVKTRILLSNKKLKSQADQASLNVEKIEKELCYLQVHLNGELNVYALCSPADTRAELKAI